MKRRPVTCKTLINRIYCMSLFYFVDLVTVKTVFMKYTFVLSIMLFFACKTIAQQRLVIRSYKKTSAKVKKGKYKMKQFTGRWQETEKTHSKTKETVAITDTFYIRFYENGTADTKQGNSVVITGTTELFVDDYITTSANDFKIISVTPNIIVLDDLGGFQHRFNKTDLFAYEVKQDPPKPVTDRATAIIDLSGASLIKNWFAYKREAIPGFIKPETFMITKLNIKEKQGENYFAGEIEFAQYGKALVQTCTLVFTNNMVTISAAANTWHLEIFKADGKEMILGNKDGLVYYFQNGN